MITRHSHEILWFLDELSARVVAQSGIPSDRQHLGKIFLQSFRDAPDFTMQIDGGTGEMDTFQSALERSVRCATALKNLGLKPNDVVATMGPNIIDLPIVLYAGTYLGVGVAGFDYRLTIGEFRNLFKQCPPKVIFCPSESVNNLKRALEELSVSVHIITFDKIDNCMSFREFLDKYADDKPPEEFIPNDFDPRDTYAIIASTSGTTGVPKITPLTHANVIINFPVLFAMFVQFPTPVKMALCMSPVQWLSSQFIFTLSPILRFPRLQTSLPVTADHIYDLINKYKPSFFISSPTFLTTLLKPGDRNRCDFSCVEYVFVGGSAVPTELLNTAKKVLANAVLCSLYGMTEASGLMLNGEDCSGKSCGRELGSFKYRIVDPITGQDISEANKPGELWVKGPAVFKGYYNNPKANADAFSDGWFKSGDIFYRDENYFYYFVDRLKLLLKYKSHQISPVEIEKVILKLPGVLDVAVTGIPDDEAGDLPVACIIPHEGCNITAQEVKDLVKEELSDPKQLRGGVVFLKELPLTSTSKVNRNELKILVKTMDRQ